MTKPIHRGLSISLPLLPYHSQQCGQGQRGIEEQLKGSAGDVGWHIRKLLELELLGWTMTGL